MTEKIDFHLCMIKSKTKRRARNLIVLCNILCQFDAVLRELYELRLP